MTQNCKINQICRSAMSCSRAKKVQKSWIFDGFSNTILRYFVINPMSYKMMMNVILATMELKSGPTIISMVVLLVSLMRRFFDPSNHSLCAQMKMIAATIITRQWEKCNDSKVKIRVICHLVNRAKRWQTMLRTWCPPELDGWVQKSSLAFWNLVAYCNFKNFRWGLNKT